MRGGHLVPRTSYLVSRPQMRHGEGASEESTAICNSLQRKQETSNGSWELTPLPLASLGYSPLPTRFARPGETADSGQRIADSFYTYLTRSRR